jgi:hypothetical protein
VGQLQRSLSCWGTTRHRGAFKIAAGVPPSSPGHAGGLLDWAVTRRRDGSPFSKWSKFVDKDLIGVRFSYVDGRILEVTAVDPKIPWDYSIS